MSIKIALLDIETSPCLGWFWRTGKQVVNAGQLLEPNKIICVSYMMLGDKHAKCIAWDKNQDDKKLLVELTKFVEQADYIVGYNSDKFDVRQINARVAYHGLKPIKWSTLKDIYKLAKKKFDLPSMKLGYLLKYFDVGSKLRTDAELWLDVWLKKDKKALEYMMKYCIQDTEALAKLVGRILPHIGTIHNFNIDNDDACPTCGNEKLIRWGYRYSAAGKHQRYKCDACGKDCVSKKTGGKR